MADYQADSPNNISPNNTAHIPPGSRQSAPQFQAPQFQDRLSEEYTIDTPENVTFGYEVAGIGSRFVAAFIDNLILTAILFALNIAVFVFLATLADNMPSSNFDEPSTDQEWVGYLVIAIYTLINFMIIWGYYLLFEWFWHGQTPGKRAAKLRVVRIDGSPVSFVPVAVRNLVRIVDMLPAAYGVGVVTMFCNRESRRLGDFAAGTLVIKDQGELNLTTLMAEMPQSAPAALRTEIPTELSTAATSTELPIDQDWSSVRRLSAADYELVQETIARYRTFHLDTKLLSRVAIAIATKLEDIPSSSIEGIKQANAEGQLTFLKNVAAAYGRWMR